VISDPIGGSLVRGTTYAIGLGTSADNAHHFVYADELGRRNLEHTAVPVGISCRFCERSDCNQRASPSFKFAFAVDEYVKKDNFFSPLTDADTDSARKTVRLPMLPQPEPDLESEGADHEEPT
jgi:hypothetical protein